ncbi:MAG: amidohydrolase family protein [Phycisphaerae bacterium]|nr:amidohydrolase family protein [Phycisphaerae bacterium]
MHVHIMGNGSGGTGCRLRASGWRRLMVMVMLKHIGVPPEALCRGLDRLYVERLLQFVRQSSLGSVVILAQDQVYDDDGRVIEGILSYYVPNSYVLELGRRHHEFLPGVSIHPARPDALEELERCLAGGAVLMKCLPISQNIDCNDRRYRRFWERMAEAGLPLLAHTGSEHILPVVRPELADPRVLRLPLECGVTVIAAHCGTRSSPFTTDYFAVFAEMTRRYRRLYGDLSAFNMPIRGSHVRQCLQEPLVRRMLHGSDYPVPVVGHRSWIRGLIDWSTLRRWQRHPNVLERDYQFKRAMGFPEEVFTRVNQLLRM